MLNKKRRRRRKGRKKTEEEKKEKKMEKKKRVHRSQVWTLPSHHRLGSEMLAPAGRPPKSSRRRAAGRHLRRDWIRTWRAWDSKGLRKPERNTKKNTPPQDKTGKKDKTTRPPPPKKKKKREDKLWRKILGRKIKQLAPPPQKKKKGRKIQQLATPSPPKKQRDARMDPARFGETASYPTKRTHLTSPRFMCQPSSCGPL